MEGSQDLSLRNAVSQTAEPTSLAVTNKGRSSVLEKFHHYCNQMLIWPKSRQLSGIQPRRQVKGEKIKSLYLQPGRSTFSTKPKQTFLRAKRIEIQRPKGQGIYLFTLVFGFH